MIFEAKLRKIGSTQGIYIPTKVITELGFKIGEVITFKVEDKEEVITKEEIPQDVITPNPEKKNVSFERHKMVFNKKRGTFN